MRSLWRKRRGKIDLLTGLYFMILMTALLAVQFQLVIFSNISVFMEDALVASNLASAIVDLREFGTTGIVCIASPDTAYELYRESLRCNLSLDENWNSTNTEMIAGEVTIQTYEIYDVIENDVTIYSYGESGSHMKTIPEGLGSVKTPDGTLVESTSIYSRISFPVKGIFGVEIEAVKQKTVDIIRMMNQETGGI